MNNPTKPVIVLTRDGEPAKRIRKPRTLKQSWRTTDGVKHPVTVRKVAGR